MKLDQIGRLALALARIVVYIITGVHLGNDGKEVISNEASSVVED